MRAALCLVAACWTAPVATRKPPRPVVAPRPTPRASPPPATVEPPYVVDDPDVLAADLVADGATVLTRLLDGPVVVADLDANDVQLPCGESARDAARRIGAMLRYAKVGCRRSSLDRVACTDAGMKMVWLDLRRRGERWYVASVLFATRGRPYPTHDLGIAELVEHPSCSR